MFSWQYNIATGVKKPFLNIRNKALGGTVYNPLNDQRYATWENGAMIDISSTIGVENTFLINIHSHTWVEGDRFLNPSKATSIQSYKSGGQTLILKGVPR